MAIPEPDWRRFREVHKTLLERYCARVLADVVAASQDTRGSAHDRYLKVFKLIEERDRQLGIAFDDFRRSTAIMQLGIMRGMRLLTDEDLNQFSEPTRNQVEGIASLGSRR